MRAAVLILIAAASAFGQSQNQAPGGANPLAILKTDDQIAAYQLLIRSTPEDLHYQNRLAAAYIQKVRETTDFSYLDRASKIVDNVVAADRHDYEALRLRSEIELERHNFARVAEDSRELTKIAPDDPWNWGTLGDALIELGQYDAAAEAYQKMVVLRPDMASYNRAAWFRFLAGDMPGAIEIMQRAISSGSPSPENTAWCFVELGKLYLKSGRSADAEKAFGSAVKAFPGYHPGYGGLGQAQAIQGKATEAIANYERAQASTPLPDYAAALYDLYRASGDEKKAQQEHDLIDVYDHLNLSNGEKANRNVAMIFSDHGWRPERALELAEAEIQMRKDIYTQDALAWALYRNKRYPEAKTAIGEAMKMGTPEPMFYYHAQQIALAMGDEAKAAEYSQKIKTLNPEFRP
ncbi:MAG TPA: tetratricopeptide repeat protein [Bryobacteraceae bacterium]|jgi:tetratricopeptide (TPR) repeat protein